MEERVIRTAQGDDWDEVGELWKKSRKELQDKSGVEEFEVHSDNVERWLSYAKSELEVLVAHKGEGLAGFIAYENPVAHTLERNYRWAKIHDLYVRDDYRGGGIGGDLVEEVKLLVDRPIRVVGDKDVQEFYEVYGFEPLWTQMEYRGEED